MPSRDPSRSAVESGIRLARPIRSAIRVWAVDAYPEEACGVLVGRCVGAKSIVERAFLAGNLERELRASRYELDPRDHLAAWRWARQRGLEIVGFWHSHPDHPAGPSERDRQRAWEKISYLIVSVNRSGAGEMRSWRIVEGRFVEESLER